MKKIFALAALALVSSFAFAQNFACVNYQELVYLAPEADQVRSTMEEAAKVNNDVLNEMVQEYQTKLDQYNKNKSVWSETIRKSKETELAQFEERLSATQQQMQAELKQKEQELYAPIIEKVNGTIEKLSKAKGVVYVLDRGNFVYFDASKAVDLTTEARKELGIPDDRTIEALMREMQEQAQAQAQQQ